jgi:hypothetical protein
MALRGTTFSRDNVQGAEVVIDSRVCDCCPLSAALTSEGVIVAYRDRSPDEIRDVHVARLTAGRWTAPALVHRDGWKLTGCPVNGPSVSAVGRDVAVAWFTVQNGEGRALVAFSRDAGRTFGAPVRVDDGGAAGRVQAALLAAGTAAISWIEVAGGQSRFRIRTIGPGAERSSAITIAERMGSQHPRMARRGDELLIAWTEFTRGSTRVHTARAPLTKKGT